MKEHGIVVYLPAKIYSWYKKQAKMSGIGYLRSYVKHILISHYAEKRRQDGAA